MSWSRAKPTGWAAFDLQQKQKDHFVAQPNNEPFPSLSSKVTQTTSSRNNPRYMKPFSSLIVPSPVSFPATLGSNQSEPSEVGYSVSSEIAWGGKFGSVFKQLKERYSWADDSLIEDVMAAADNDFDKASSFLKAMVSDENLEKDNKPDAVAEPSHDFSTMEPVLSSLAQVENGGVRDGFDLCAEKASDSYMDMNAILDQFTSMSVEPEGDEDDLYLSCRKDAIKMMRAAVRHSKSATNSFLRGDHFAARQFSQKAREEWEAAKRLNEKAASEILSIRNANNGLWRLDLHGLHAAEAVQALQERLHKIETQILSKKKGSTASALTNSFGNKAVVSHASSGVFSNKERKLDQQAFFGQKPNCLEVITGIGNHSKGGAALPTAVQTFLADNGYRFDESRPGVITVRPMFRRV